VGPRQSSAIALTRDNRLLVNVNPAANSVSVFDVSGAAAVKLAEITVGSDPQSVAVHPDNVRAFVANSGSASVSVLNLQTLTVTATLTVGVEPSAVALSPNGTRLYVANASSNSLTVINTANNGVVATVDLSPFGSFASVSGSPRAIAVTNNGDANDADETVFVALFFGQLRAGKTFLDEGQDDQREGRVVALSAATNTPLAAPNPILLEPLANAGFNSNGKLAPGPGQVPAVASTNPQTFATPTGCFPNQLAAIALHPTNGTGYVVSTAASPNGPLRFNQMAQGLVSLFNVAGRTEVTSAQTGAAVRQTAPLNLNQGVNFNTQFADRLFLTNPIAMSWRPDGSDAWVVIQNSDLVVRLTVDANGIPTVGNPLAAAGTQTQVRVDLEAVAAGQIAGKAPRGIVLNSTGTRAFVSNFVSKSVTAIDITNGAAPAIVATFASTASPAPGTLGAVIAQGAELFFTGRGTQGRMSQESWGGCIVCHPLNGRSDNVTWMFDAGPRQTIPLDGTFSKLNFADQRALNWSAVRDEIHDFELNTRGVFGGRGLIDDDRLFYAVGGASGATPNDVSLIEQFQQFTGVVSTTNDLQNGAPLPTLTGFGPRRDFGLATLADGRMFIIGGRSGAGQGSLIPAATAVLEFNPRKKSLVARSATGFTLRHSLGAAAVRTSQGDRIYAIGGFAATIPNRGAETTVEEFNPATNTWRTVASLPTGVAQFGITVAGGNNAADPLQLIHVVSGNTSSEGTPSVVNPNPVQRFVADPVGAGVWTGFNPAGLTLRRNHGAAWALRVVSNRVFVIGGQDAGGNVLTSVEELQTTQGAAGNVTLVATPHTDLPAGRARFGIGATLTTNQIYVFGGVDGTGADQTTIFEYTVGTNPPPPGTPGPPGTPSGAWLTRGNLSVARHGLAANPPPPVTNFLPDRSTGRDARQDSIAVWVARKVRSLRAPVPATDPGAQAGRTLFGTVGLVQPGFSCATCHGGAKWTRSQVDYNPPPSPDVGIGFGNQKVVGAELRQTSTQGPNAGQFPGVLINVGTFTLGGGRTNEIRSDLGDIGRAVAPLGANGFNIPSLLSVSETAPYFYSGLAQTLDEVLDGSKDGNGGVQHHFVANATQRAQLIQFLKSIDETTAIFP
jgi:YVTN family beta-propeller protein